MAPTMFLPKQPAMLGIATVDRFSEIQNEILVVIFNLINKFDSLNWISIHLLGEKQKNELHRPPD